MNIAVVDLKSASPYSQGKYIMEKKASDELSHEFEERTWRERCQYNEDGFIFIPPMAFANCIKEAAKYMSISVPGQGKAKFTKNFEAGVWY